VGARLHGGRFNAKGTAALYLSLDTSTAILEATQGFGNRFPPLTLVTYDVDCADLIDLTGAAALRRHQTTRAELACAWMALAAAGKPVPSWRLAERLRASGAAGLVAPSFAAGADAAAKNLVLWRWGETPPHAVRVFDPDRRLPRDARSWRDASYCVGRITAAPNPPYRRRTSCRGAGATHHRTQCACSIQTAACLATRVPGVTLPTA
jgi:RES domain-containing protein